jgi:ubiquinone/menaquinone biosynthesis C-methylase UbiE
VILIKKLEPDFVEDVRNLPFKDNKFDLVTCFEVLEHLPWEDLEKAISELKRVSKNKIIISIPYSCLSFSFWTKFPLSNYIKKPRIDFCFRLPKFYEKHKFDGEHYWEAGKKDFSLNKLRYKLKKNSQIESEHYSCLNPYHQFFILKKNLK